MHAGDRDRELLALESKRASATSTLSPAVLSGSDLICTWGKRTFSMTLTAMSGLSYSLFALAFEPICLMLSSAREDPSRSA